MQEMGPFLVPCFVLGMPFVGWAVKWAISEFKARIAYLEKRLDASEKDARELRDKRTEEQVIFTKAMQEALNAVGNQVEGFNGTLKLFLQKVG